MKRLACSVLLLVLTVPCIAAEPGYGIAELSSRTGLTGYQPENLQWHPEGRWLAYLKRDTETDEAALYLANPEDGSTRLLLDAETLSGAAQSKNDIKDEQEKEWAIRYSVSSYRWSPKGEGITFVSNNQLHFYDLASKKLAQLTHAPGAKRDLRLSPDEQWIGFVQDNTVRYARRSGGEVREVEKPEQDHLFGWPTWVYAEELDVREAWKWSEDSRYIAFLAFDETPVIEYPLANYLNLPATVDMQNYPKAGMRNPIVRVGIRDIEKNATRYIKLPMTEQDYVARIGWIKKSGDAYALLVDRAQENLQLVRIAPDSGEVTRLVKVSDPAWVDVTNDLHFLDDGRFVLGHQEDGWQHLYLYDGNGKLLRKLTPGNFNVTGLEAVDEENGWVYFSRYADGARNVQLYRAPLAGGDAQLLTPEAGVHGISMDKAGRWFVDSYSNLTTPTSKTLRTADGENMLVLAEPADLSAYHLQVPELFTIKAADGKTDLLAQRIVPPGFDPAKRYPVIMYQYGGPGVGPLVQNRWGGTGYFWENLLAHEGYVMFRVDNRAAGNFSHTQQAAIDHDLGRIELEDQMAAAKWLKSQPWVDDQHIGLSGHSYGGFMTVYALEHAPGVWAAGIAGAPVTQWHDYDTIYTERYMSTPKKNPEGYASSSTLEAANGLQDPLLLIHGTGDDNVHWQNTAHLIDALVEAGKPYELAIYPDKTHALRGEKTKQHIYRTQRAFWKRYLGR